MEYYYELETICKTLKLTAEQKNVIYAFFDETCMGDKECIAKMTITERNKKSMLRALKLKNLSIRRKFTTLVNRILSRNAAEKLKNM